jgi:hypothetical protein
VQTHFKKTLTLNIKKFQTVLQINVTELAATAEHNFMAFALVAR